MMPLLNDRLRKRRCFADKELDNVPAFSSNIENLRTNSAFRMIKISNHRSNNNQTHPKKWKDFSVAAIIGQS